VTLFFILLGITSVVIILSIWILYMDFILPPKLGDSSLFDELDDSDKEWDDDDFPY